MLICLMGGSRETPAERRIYSLKRECVQRPRPANGEETGGGSSRSNQQIANAGTMGAIWGKSAKALVQRNGTSADGRQNVLVKRVGKRGDQKLRQTIGIEAGLPFPAADTPCPSACRLRRWKPIEEERRRCSNRPSHPWKRYSRRYPRRSRRTRRRKRRQSQKPPTRQSRRL